MLEGVGQPLVDLGRGAREPLGQGQVEGFAHLRQSLCRAALADQGVAAQAADAADQVGPVGGLGARLGHVEEVEGGAEAGRGAQVGGDGEPLGGGVAAAALVVVRRGGVLAGPQGRRPLSEQLVLDREPAQQTRVRTAGPVEELAEGGDGRRVVTGQLGAAGQAVESTGACGLVRAGRPLVERGGQQAGGVTVGVGGLVVLGGCQQGDPGPVTVVTREQVAGHHGGRPAGVLEHACHGEVQRAPTGPGDVRVDGLLHQCVSEAARGALADDQQAALVERVGPAA